MKIDIECIMSPIIESSIKHTLFKNVKLIGVSKINDIYRELYCEIIPNIPTNFGFLFVRNVVTNETIEINPSYIVIIKNVNVTKIDFKHTNDNFKSGKVTVYYSHKDSTELEMSTHHVNKVSEYNIKQIHLNHHNIFD